MNDAADELLTSREVAAILKVSPEELQLLRREGRGPEYHRLGYRTLRYRRGDVQRWLGARRFQPGQPHRVNTETIMETLQAIIAHCFVQGMREPLELRISDSRGQRGGSLVYWDRDPEPLPDGTPSNWEHGYPPFEVQVTDAAGERRVFDVGVLRAADGHQVPDVRPTTH